MDHEPTLRSPLRILKGEVRLMSDFFFSFSFFFFFSLVTKIALK
jgi:hypothetical protein